MIPSKYENKQKNEWYFLTQSTQMRAVNSKGFDPTMFEERQDQSVP